MEDYTKALLMLQYTTSIQVSKNVYLCNLNDVLNCRSKKLKGFCVAFWHNETKFYYTVDSPRWVSLQLCLLHHLIKTDQ